MGGVTQDVDLSHTAEEEKALDAEIQELRQGIRKMNYAIAKVQNAADSIVSASDQLRVLDEHMSQLTAQSTAQEGDGNAVREKSALSSPLCFCVNAHTLIVRYRRCFCECVHTQACMGLDTCDSSKSKLLMLWSWHEFRVSPLACIPCCLKKYVVSCSCLQSAWVRVVFCDAPPYHLVECVYPAPPVEGFLSESGDLSGTTADVRSLLEQTKTSLERYVTSCGLSSSHLRALEMQETQSSGESAREETSEASMLGVSHGSEQFYSSHHSVLHRACMCALPVHMYVCVHVSVYRCLCECE